MKILVKRQTGRDPDAKTTSSVVEVYNDGGTLLTKMCGLGA